jgi:hypothetical protein
VVAGTDDVQGYLSGMALGALGLGLYKVVVARRIRYEAIGLEGS